MMKVAALTSYSSAPLDTKLLELAECGIRTIDLYCFTHQDLAFLCGGPGIMDISPRTILQRFHPEKAADKITQICHRIRKKTGGRRIDICGIATSLPDISLPDDHPHLKGRRSDTVKVFERLLLLLAKLRKNGFSCLTFELVAGTTVVAPRIFGKGVNRRLICLDSQRCLQALEESLLAIKEAAGQILSSRCPKAVAHTPVFAIEIEPEQSMLVCDRLSIETLLGTIQEFDSVGLNVDVGHMLIVGIEPQHIFKQGYSEKIAHVHMSDNALSHFADLRVGSWNSHSVFWNWLHHLTHLHHKNSGLFKGYVSVEMEACGDVGEVRKAYRQTREWIRKIASG